MAGYWRKQGVSFVTGFARRKDLIFLVQVIDELCEKEVPHALFCGWGNGEWLDMGDSVWRSPSIAVCEYPKAQMIGLGEGGKAWLSGNGDAHEETIADGKVSPKGRGPLTCVRCIDKKAWAVGMDRQVYRRDDVDKWVCLDKPMRPKGDAIVGFEAVGGFSGEDVYAAGWGGEIRHYDGAKWDKIKSPTKQIITNLACADDGMVYACGRQGTLLAGRDDQWKLIEHEATWEDLYSMAWFNGKLYLASLEQLWELDGDSLKPVEFEDDRPETCNHLSAADGLLWSIGPTDLFNFDGKKWTRID